MNISKNELALLLETTPETISRLFTKLSEEGVIEQKGRIIKYLAPQEHSSNLSRLANKED